MAEKFTWDAFQDLTPLRRLIIDVRGMHKSGKTDFFIRGAPEGHPIRHIILDPNGEAVAKKVLADTGRPAGVGGYAHKTIDFERGMGMQDAKKEWDAFLAAYTVAAEEPGPGVVIVDTATEVDELMRIQLYGKLEKVPTFKYGERNKMWKTLFKQAYDSEKTFAFIHKMKKEYERGPDGADNSDANARWTGKYEAAQWAGTLHEVQAAIHMSWSAADQDFKLLVLENNMKQEMKGDSFLVRSEGFTLDLLLEMTYPS